MCKEGSGVQMLYTTLLIVNIVYLWICQGPALPPPFRTCKTLFFLQVAPAAGNAAVIHQQSHGFLGCGLAAEGPQVVDVAGSNVGTWEPAWRRARCLVWIYPAFGFTLAVLDCTLELRLTLWWVLFRGPQPQDARFWLRVCQPAEGSSAFPFDRCRGVLGFYSSSGGASFVYSCPHCGWFPVAELSH